TVTLSNRRQEACDGAVEENIGWLGRLVPKVHRDRMALVRTDALPIVGQGEALLRAGGDDLIEIGPGQPASVPSARVEQHIDGDPTASVGREARGRGLVPEHVAQELADGCSALLIHDGLARWMRSRRE